MRRRLALLAFLLVLGLLGSAGPPSAARAAPAAAPQLLAALDRESAARGEVDYYQVRPGDTLSGIAMMLAVDVDTLQQLNDLADPSAIQVGDRLVVPDAPTGPVRWGVPQQPHPNGDAPAMIWPALGPITTAFGVPGPDWVGGYHMGLDIGAPEGAPILAAAAGVVEVASMDTQHGYGNFVLIRHSPHYETAYAHMLYIQAKVGETVKQGQVIGYVGATGFVTGPHLHFEVRRDGVKINPAPFLPSN
jgi:murein DD-endopeptidase MepM/ murein hydrolase activator NlpD